MGISLGDLDKVTLGFLLDLFVSKEFEADGSEEIEATPEIMASFF